MIIIPAIDIIEGACVRLVRGKFDTPKKYFSDPVKVAERWENEGACWLHVIDLDGAKQGKVKNMNIVRKIKEKTGLKIEMGGGIRDFSSLKEVLDSGIDRAIIGTRAIEDPVFLEQAAGKYNHRIIVSLDFDRKGTVLKDGWQEPTDYDLYSLISRLEKMGMDRVIITDVNRDGMLEGIDDGTIRKIVERTSLKLIVAGGVSSIEDVILLKKIGVWGAIIGKALYESRIDLGLAIKEAENVS